MKRAIKTLNRGSVLNVLKLEADIRSRNTLPQPANNQLGHLLRRSYRDHIISTSATITLGNHRLRAFDIIRAEDVFNRMTIFHLSGSELVLPGRLLWFLLQRLSG